MKRKEFNALIDTWQEEGLVSFEQAQRMKSDVADYSSGKSGDIFISAVTYIGATALSLGALLLIASNWEHLTKSVKLVLTVLMPVVPLCFAYWKMHIQNRTTVLARSFGILGLALVGGSLALIGQIYNLEQDIVAFLWTWTVLTLPFVFIFKMRENVLFSAIMTGAALLAFAVDFLDAGDIDDWAAILIMTILGLLYAYILYSIGNMLRKNTIWEASGRLLRIGGALLGAVVLFITTFEEYAREVIEGFRLPISYDWVVLTALLNLLFVGFLVFVLMRSVRHEEYSLAFTIVRFFGVYLLVKYFTLFFDMMDTGLFFIIGGILFIAGGWLLERKKSVLVTYMRNVHDERQ